MTLFREYKMQCIGLSFFFCGTEMRISVRGKPNKMKTIKRMALGYVALIVGYYIIAGSVVSGSPSLLTAGAVGAGLFHVGVKAAELGGLPKLDFGNIGTLLSKMGGSFVGAQGQNMPDVGALAGKALGLEDDLTPLDYFMLDIIPRFIGQSPNNENGTKIEFKKYSMEDTSNDDAYRLTGQELIARSGYKYELYEAIADDGYVTQLTRIVNPLADRKYLRYPPVLLEHGGTIDPTAYLIASSIQHHPEKWPRTYEDGPITSWNRSLAFVLANNGFDVWLAETRGSNDRNKKHIRSKAFKSVFSGKNNEKNMTVGESINELTRSWDYWDFSQDDIINHELKSHMDTVFQLTGAKKISLMTFSLSTPTSLAFLSIRPEYAEKIQGYVSMAPIVSGEGVNHLIKLVLQGICPLLPDQIGTLLITDALFTQPSRELIVLFGGNKQLRYSFQKAFISLLMGPSAKYQTLLDLNVLGHMLRQLSFKEAKQLCQQTRANKLQKFDYGPIKNKLVYNTTEPPIYDLSNLRIKDWIVVAAANDKLATLEVLEHLIKMVNPKPIAKIIAPGFNHLDLIAAYENDKYVNMPIMRYLESVSYTPGEEDLVAAGARKFDITTFFPQEQEDTGSYKKKKQPQEAFPFDIAKTMSNITSINPDLMIETIKKNIAMALKKFGEMFPASKELTKSISGASSNENSNYP